MEDNQEDKYELPPLAAEPWLIATHKNNKTSNKPEKQTFRTNTNSYIKTIPELDQNVIVVASQGWLILRDRKDCNIYSLWNPVTSQFLRLPKLLPAPELEDDKQPSVCLLTESLYLDNNSDTCMLVLFYDEGIVISCRPTMSQNCSWVKQSLELDGISNVEIRVACAFGGVIYGYAYGEIKDPFDDRAYAHTFVRINVIKDSSSSIKLELMTEYFPNSKINFQVYSVKNRMVESCGILYFIHVMFRGSDDEYMDIIKVLVWRLDFSQMEWVRVESLGNRAFLIDGSSCTWCWAGSRSSSGGFIEENYIYYAETNKQKVYSYNLQDDSYTLLLPHSAPLRFFDGPNWFMPSNPQRYELFCMFYLVQSTSYLLTLLLAPCLIYFEIGRYLPNYEGNHNNTKTKNIQKTNQEFQEKVEDNTPELSSGTLLSELPLDILQSIAKYLILFDYMNLRVTCKNLHKANPPAQWRANGQYPVLMIYKDFSKTYELLDPIENVSRTIAALNESPEILSNIESCKDGWFLLSSGRYLVYLNPFKNETLKYPPCLAPCPRFGFSTCPTSSDCLTVGICNFFSAILISCFDAAVGEWAYIETELNYDKDIKILRNNKSGPMYHKNAFYYPGTDGSIAELKFVQGETSWKVYDHPFDEKTKFESSYLVEHEGELVSVFIGENGNWVKVFKFDILGKCWMKLDNLGGHAFFVCSASSFSVKTEKSEMRNRIYLPRRKENEVVFYSFETGKYHTPRGANSMDNFDGTKAQSFCCWGSMSL